MYLVLRDAIRVGRGVRELLVAGDRRRFGNNRLGALVGADWLVHLHGVVQHQPGGFGVGLGVGGNACTTRSLSFYGVGVLVLVVLVQLLLLFGVLVWLW